MTLALIAEFRGEADLIGAAQRLSLNGFTAFDSFAPAPIPALDRLLPRRRGALLAAIMAGAGVFGFAGAMALQYYAAAIAFPVNVGGRPLDSWPAFVPSAWEICALCTVYAGAWVLFVLCRLPRFYHPVFAAPGFERASQDRFFLAVEARDPRFDADRIRFIFERQGAIGVSEVGA